MSKENSAIFAIFAIVCVVFLWNIDRKEGVGAGKNRRARWKKTGQGNGIRTGEVKNWAFRIVPEQRLPREWSGIERRAYYAFLQQALPMYQRRNKWRGRISTIEAVEDLTRIFEEIPYEDKELFSIEYSMGFKSLLPLQVGDGPEYWYKRHFWSLNDEKKKPVRIRPSWIEKFNQYSVFKDFDSAEDRWNTSVPVNFDGEEITPDSSKLRKNSIRAFEKWANKSEDGSRFRLPPLPDISKRVANRVLKHYTNRTLMDISPENRTEAMMIARKIVQLADAQGSGYKGHTLFGSTGSFKYFNG